MDNSKTLKNRILLKNNMMPPVFTVAMFVLMISFVMILKIFVYNSYEKVSIPALHNNYVIDSNSELNEQEQAVLTMLYSTLNLSDTKLKENSSVALYFNTLNNFFCKSRVNLTPEAAAKAETEIRKIQVIINHEKHTDIMLMSLDGRKVVTYILQQTYDICGLTIEGDLEEKIKTISDKSGNVLYRDVSAERHPEFQIYALSITIIFLLALLGILVIISRKNQLFNREDVYNGFDEERFA